MLKFHTKKFQLQFREVLCSHNLLRSNAVSGLWAEATDLVGGRPPKQRPGGGGGMREEWSPDWKPYHQS